MLNNNKSLLIRVRIAMTVIVNLIGISGAWAVKTPSRQTGENYRVYGTTNTGNHYIVTSRAVIPGTYACNSSDDPCIVNSSVEPSMRNGSWEVPKVDAVIVQLGIFEQ